METKPLISVIMPVYNVEHYVGRAIESIQNQNFSSYEIICVDDCSTDSSYSVLESYASKDPKIKLYRNDFNIGVGANKNKAMRCARGRYICFCDADDYLSNGMFESLAGYISRFDVDGIVYGSEYWLGTQSSPCKFVDYLKNGVMYSPYEILKFHVLEKKFYTSAARVIIKKLYIEKIQAKFTEGTVCDDLQYTLCMMLQHQGNFMYLKESFYNYCNREGSSSAGMIHGSFLCEFLNVIYQYRENCGNIPVFLQEYLYGILANLYITINTKEKKVFSQYVSTQYGNDILCKVLSSSTSQYFKNIDIVISNVENNDSDIYIYGAGKYAVDLYRVLKAYGICVSGFVVSSLDGNVASIDDVKVFNIDDVACKICDSLILVATSPKHHDNIVRSLGEYSFYNVILCK